MPNLQSPESVASKNPLMTLRENQGVDLSIDFSNADNDFKPTYIVVGKTLLQITYEIINTGQNRRAAFVVNLVDSTSNPPTRKALRALKDGEDYTIGREDNTMTKEERAKHIPIEDDDTVSRKHAIIQGQWLKTERYLHVENLSQNGTRVQSENVITTEQTIQTLSQLKTTSEINAAIDKLLPLMPDKQQGAIIKAALTQIRGYIALLEINVSDPMINDLMIEVFKGSLQKDKNDMQNSSLSEELIQRRAKRLLVATVAKLSLDSHNYTNKGSELQIRSEADAGKVHDPRHGASWNSYTYTLSKKGLNPLKKKVVFFNDNDKNYDITVK